MKTLNSRDHVGLTTLKIAPNKVNFVVKEQQHALSPDGKPGREGTRLDELSPEILISEASPGKYQRSALSKRSSLSRHRAGFHAHYRAKRGDSKPKERPYGDKDGDSSKRSGDKHKVRIVLRRPI